MRILHGTKVIEAPAGWREIIDRDDRSVVVDLGAGDGRFVYENARRDAEKLYIGVDPDAGSLADYAFRAARKPSRGGVENAVFVVAALEQLPAELEGLANVIRVNFPWGGLLRGLLRPEDDALRRLVSLGQEGTPFEIVFTYDPQHDLGAFPGEALPALDEAYINEALVEPYAGAGLVVETRRRLSQDEALAIPSTWGRRLLHGRPREVYELQGRGVRDALIG
jgi:hypothetical protein